LRIAIASDHAGFLLKEAIKRFLWAEGHEVVDFGTSSEESVDYPEFGYRVAEAVATGKVERGIAICGTGIGMSMVANKVAGIRAALCVTPEMARYSRRHNDANVLTLGGWILTQEQALEIVRVWLETPFDGGRHERRIRGLHQLTGR